VTTPVDLSALRAIAVRERRDGPQAAVDWSAGECLAVLDALAAAVADLAALGRTGDHVFGRHALRALDKITALVTPEGETR